MQTLIIGIGTWVASNLPWLITKLGVSNVAEAGVVPMSVKIAFTIGGAIFFLSILYTILTTKEYPPEDMDKFKDENEKSKGFFKGVAEITSTIFSMPKTMLKLGLVQFFSWFAFFAMWSIATPALTSHVFNASFPDVNLFDLTDAVQKANYEAGMQLYNDAADLVGSYMGMYGLSSMAFALLLTLYTSKFRINRKFIHMASLFAGGAGFIMMYFHY